MFMCHNLEGISASTASKEVNQENGEENTNYLNPFHSSCSYLG